MPRVETVTLNRICSLILAGFPMTFPFLIHSENRTEKVCQIKSYWDLEANSFQLLIYINH